MSHVFEMSKLKAWFATNLGWPLGTIFFVSFALVYVIPLQWVRAIPGMNEFLAFVPAHVPGIKQYIAVSQMPKLASVFFPIMAAVSPLAFFTVWCVPPRKGSWCVNFWERPLRNLFCVLFICLVVFVASLATYSSGGYELDSFSVKDSPFYLATFGTIYAGAVIWLCLGAVIRTIYSIFSKEGF